MSKQSEQGSECDVAQAGLVPGIDNDESEHGMELQRVGLLLQQEREEKEAALEQIDNLEAQLDRRDVEQQQVIEDSAAEVAALQRALEELDAGTYSAGELGSGMCSAYSGGWWQCCV